MTKFIVLMLILFVGDDLRAEDDLLIIEKSIPATSFTIGDNVLFAFQSLSHLAEDDDIVMELESDFAGRFNGFFAEINFGDIRNGQIVGFLKPIGHISLFSIVLPKTIFGIERKNIVINLVLKQKLPPGTITISFYHLKPHNAKRVPIGTLRSIKGQ